MKKPTFFLLVLLSTLFCATETIAQDITTEGTEFWVSFMGNGFKNHPDEGIYIRTQLIISSKQDCSCTVQNPRTGWIRTFDITADSTYLFDEIDPNEAYMEMNEYETAKDKGLIVASTAPISVYCSNIANYSFDASYVLPTPALANDYLIQTYDQSLYSSDHTSAFIIIATEDDTEIDITPSVKTLGNKPAGQEFSITLQKGQVYQVRSHNESWFGGGESRDLSGTRVTARDCKKIAVFNGNNLTQVPNGGADSDCIFEQAMPLQSWGKKFVVTASLDRRHNDLVKITSAHNDNEIHVSGRNPFTLSEGESRTIALNENEKSCFIEASRSCVVYLYNHSKDPGTTPTNPWEQNDDGMGAPSMVYIAPIEQRIENITFSTFNYESEHETDIDDHYVNIIVSSEDTGDVVLDGNTIEGSQFEAVNGTDAYKFFRTRIEHGTHHLSCPGGFNAHIYGFGNARGYAYMAGSKAADLTTAFTINETTAMDGDTVTDCSLSPIIFKVDMNYSQYNVTWDFGDGATSTDETAQHSYAQNGFYTVTFKVEADGTACIEATSQTTTFYIDAQQNDNEEYSDDICIGGHYNGHGFVDVPIAGDTILSRPIDPDHTDPCQGNVIVHITTHFDEPETEVITECGHYTWQNGVTYSESQTDSDTIQDPETGCYMIKHLQLTILHAPDSCVIRTTSHSTAPWVVPGNEFQINAYDFFLDSLNAEYGTFDSVAWQLCQRDATTGQLVEATLNWRLAVSGERNELCRVYPFNHTNDTVWLRATAFNACFSQGVTHDYWMVCSFYGVGDNAFGTGKFSVVPNPNQGLVELRLEHLENPADVKVYDMRGCLVDAFRAAVGSMTYDMRHQPNGIYFFVATTEQGIKAQKVILAK